MATTNQIIKKPSSDWVTWGQWLALITMTLDHIARYVVPHAWNLGWIDSTIGRVAFPLFAGMVAWHGLFNTRNPIRYARRITVIGLLAQIPYQLMPRTALIQFNICFTLALGLLAGTWLMRLKKRLDNGTASYARITLETVLMICAWYFIGPWVEYSHLGLLLIPCFMVAINAVYYGNKDINSLVSVLIACIPLLLVSGLMNSSSIAKSITVATSICILLLAAGANKHIANVPWLMPRKLWLAWYPGHFAIIAAFLLLIGSADLKLLETI